MHTAAAAAFFIGIVNGSIVISVMAVVALGFLFLFVDAWFFMVLHCYV